MLNSNNFIKVLLILLLVFTSKNISAQHEKLQLNEWITNWYLLGPIKLEVTSSEVNHLGGFETDFLARFGGEGNPKIELGKKQEYGGNIVSWIEYTSPDSIINLDNAINEYQMFVNVSKNSGGDVSCNGHCNDNFSDIRFVDIDNVTFLDYWMEKRVDGNNAWFWVEEATFFYFVTCLTEISTILPARLELIKDAGCRWY